MHIYTPSVVQYRRGKNQAKEKSRILCKVRGESSGDGCLMGSMCLCKVVRKRRQRADDPVLYRRL
jgi:hypothetical protein